MTKALKYEARSAKVTVKSSDGEMHVFEGVGMNFFQEESGQVRIYITGQEHALACFFRPIWVKREL